MKKENIKNISILSILAINFPILKILPIIIIPKFKFTKIDLFYISLIVIGFINFFIKFFTQGIEFNYIVLFLFSIFIFLLALILSKAARTIAEYLTYDSLLNFYLINFGLLIITYIVLTLHFKTIMIFDAGGSSVGDSFRGLFQHSHLLMMVFSFYSVLFLARKEYIKFLSSLLGMILASFNAGFLIYVFVFLFTLPFIYSDKSILRIYIIFFVCMTLFALINMENIKYSIRKIKPLFEFKQPGKITSFVETYKYLTSGFKEFMFGAGVGEFSSRTAFAAGGEYVSWYPESFVYKSKIFSANHFNLWNRRIYSNPVNEGTINQPFSFYNQIFGEYGFLGFLCFIILYVNFLFKYVRHNKFKILVLLFMLGYFTFDYYFEYLSIVPIFELFMSLPDNIYQKEK